MAFYKSIFYYFMIPMSRRQSFKSLKCANDIHLKHFEEFYKEKIKVPTQDKWVTCSQQFKNVLISSTCNMFLIFFLYHNFIATEHVLRYLY